MNTITKALLITSILFISNFSYSQPHFYHPNSGVKISFGLNDNMFPKSWTEGDINGQAKALSPKEYKRSKRIIIEALDKYPVEILKQNLSEVYILNSLMFYNQVYGGTNSNNNVYLVNSGKLDGYSDEYVEQLFHAEFSSILLRNYSNENFESKWEQINKNDFQFGKGGVDEIKTGKASTDFLPEYFKKGFLYQYAMSGLENDFNSISKNLFCPNNSLWKKAYRYQKIKLKIILTIDFYNNISDTFNIEYFKEFEKE